MNGQIIRTNCRICIYKAMMRCWINYCEDWVREIPVGHFSAFFLFFVCIMHCNIGLRLLIQY
jgi:hypothetical protein